MFFQHEVQPLSDTWGISGKFTITAMLNHFDNVAMQHAALTGDDVLERSKNAVNWIMTGWDIRILNLPKNNEKFNIKTWVNDKISTFSSTREFLLMDSTGNPCVKAQAYISILDLVRNRPVRFNDTDLSRYQPEPDTVIEAPIKKIAAPKEFTAEKTLIIRRSDIDFNEHVHNTTYLTLAMEVLPEDLYREQNFQAIRINFKKALLLDDVATIKLSPTENGYVVSIYKEADQLCCLVEFVV